MYLPIFVSALAIAACFPLIGQDHELTAGAPFRPSAGGCAMAHCDPQMSDWVNLLSPEGTAAALRGRDTAAPGSGIGLGCASNGTTAVCSYKGATVDAVVAYDANGNRLWTSQALLGPSAFTSAPMIDDSGGVIAADRSHIVRFSPQGKPLWAGASPKGIPISPTQTSSGALVVATSGGPVSVYNSVTGALLGSLYLYQNGVSGPFFDTVNTPCAAGNRTYVLTALAGDPQQPGRLYAIDVDPANAAQPLSVAWYWEFGGPSGASPTCVPGGIIFDGAAPVAGVPSSPTLFALRDDADHATLLWSQPVSNPVPASVAHDPRGGVWVIGTQYPRVERRSESTGLVIDGFSLSALVNDGTKYVPSSALSISGTPTRPILTVGAFRPDGTRSLVLAVDLLTRTLLWSFDLTPMVGANGPAGQFPMALDAAGHPVVVFSARTSGAYFVGLQ